MAAIVRDGLATTQAGTARAGRRQIEFLSPDSAEGKSVQNILQKFKIADGYGGFQSLYMPDPKTGLPRLTKVGCWSHARRKVYEVYEATASPLANEALERIAELFAIEERINGRATGAPGRPPAGCRSAAGRA
jgi:Transposase IS66 family